MRHFGKGYLCKCEIIKRLEIKSQLIRPGKILIIRA